jgi:hypothetical protein
MPPEQCSDSVAVIEHDNQNVYHCLPHQEMTVKQLYGDTAMVECRCNSMDAGTNSTGQ